MSKTQTPVDLVSVAKKYPWIHVVGKTFSGKSALLQEIVASSDRPIVFIFNPQRIGETIEEARKIEKSIYLLHRKCQDGLQVPKTLIVIHEWWLLFKLASDRHRLHAAIADLFRKSKQWGVAFATASQTVELEPVYGDRPCDTDSEAQVKIFLGDLAQEIARQTWKTTDARYLWLLKQDRPCVVCRNNSIELATAPEFQANPTT